MGARIVIADKELMFILSKKLIEKNDCAIEKYSYNNKTYIR